MPSKQITVPTTQTTVAALLGLAQPHSWAETWQIVLNDSASTVRVGVQHLNAPATANNPTTYSHQYKWGERNDSQQFGKVNLFDVYIVADGSVVVGIQWTPRTY